MILKIYGEIQSNERLWIKIGQEVEVLDNLDPAISFCINEKGNYDIEIEQKISKSNREPLHILLYILTVVIQGIFNILLINTMSKWYDDIRAYCIKATLHINLQQEMDMHLTYINARYNEADQTWRHPIFTVEPHVILEHSFVRNPCDFKNCYFSYIKRLISVSIILVSVLSILLFIAITNTIILAIFFISILIIGVVILVISLSISEYRRLKNLLKTFYNN